MWNPEKRCLKVLMILFWGGEMETEVENRLVDTVEEGESDLN